MAGIELGCPYSVSVGGVTAVFNVPSDPNFVGYTKDVTGLDMYGVRENAQVVTAGDGGYHGPFWRDRRPFTLAGFIQPAFPLASRDAAQNKLSAVAGGCFRTDGTLLWTPAGDGIQRGINFRTQQPLRLTIGQSNVEKNFLFAGVCRDWRILTWAQSSVTAVANGATTFPANPSTTNNGNADGALKLTLTGPMTFVSIQNSVSLKKLTFTGSGLVVAAGTTAVIDLTGVYPVITNNGSDVSNLIDPLNTDYTIGVVPGASTWTITASGMTSGTSQAQIQWNDSWH